MTITALHTEIETAWSEGSERRLIPGLPTPFPLAPLLPSLLHADDFAVRLCSAFDEVAAPILGVLDQIDSYLDPWLAPSDFLVWLASWVGVELDDHWPLDQGRAAVSGAVDRYRQRGTVAGIVEAVSFVFGRAPEVEDSGGTVVSPAPGAALPGSDTPSLIVRLRVPDPASVDVRALDDLVEALKPAHLPHRVEVLEP